MNSRFSEQDNNTVTADSTIVDFSFKFEAPNNYAHLKAGLFHDCSVNDRVNGRDEFFLKMFIFYLNRAEVLLVPEFYEQVK